MDHLLRCSGYEIVKQDITCAEGCYLYEAFSRKYVDFETGVSCAILGHSHRRVNQIIRAQIGQIIHPGYRFTNNVMEKEGIAKLLENLEEILHLHNLK